MSKIKDKLLDLIPSPEAMKKELGDGLLKDEIMSMRKMDAQDMAKEMRSTETCDSCKGKGKIYFAQGEDVKEDVCDICQGEGIMYVQNGEDSVDSEICFCKD